MRRIAVIVAALAASTLLAAGPAAAQRVTRDSAVIRRDSAGVRRAPGRDSAAADTSRQKPVIPTAPSRRFPAADSVIEALARRRGFRATRYAADSVQLLADEKELRLAGHGLIEREQSTLEADTVRYVESECLLVAAGAPRLFDPSGTLMGAGMRYDACNRAGIILAAKTEMPYGSGKWLLVGDIAVDNNEDRMYASNAVITSCLMEEPHYAFESRQVKWVSKSLMVSRPAVLYVSDVPILWLPFIFQDTRRGRRSGVLAPQFGINDIIRFNAGYSRHVSNIGYYFAISDYTDAQVSMDWFASRYTTFNGQFRYRLLSRFLQGGITVQEMREHEGSSSRYLRWNHMQQFSTTSQLTANIEYASSSRIVSRNAVDPILAVGSINSGLNYSRRFAGGTLNMGGSRRQSLDKPEVSLSFPTLTFTPAPIALGRAVTWSPSLNFTNSLLTNGGTRTPVVIGPGLFDSLLTDSRNSSLTLATPFRVGRWNLTNGVVITDQWNNQRLTVTDTATGNVTTYSEQFETTIDWNTGVGLPVLFQGSWNLQPSVSMVNTAGGAFMIRNAFTNGQYVSQGKRFQFAVGVAPTLFGLFPGFGPVSRFRHALSPILAYAYSPEAEIPEEYARARNAGQLPAAGLTQPARQSITLGLSQNIEAKLRPPVQAGADTLDAETPEGATPPEGRKIKLLSIQSGGIGYDFEQDKEPGRNGWTTDSWSNTISSDLVRGFTMNFTHDLFDGPVGFDSARLAPTLTSMTFGFSLGAGALNMVRRLIGLAPQRLVQANDTASSVMSSVGRTASAFQRGPEAAQYSSVERLTPSRGGGGFQAQFNYSLQRSRPEPGRLNANNSNSMLGGNIQFSPTSHWTVAWSSTYNFTQGTFAEHVVRLDRDLHDWRATFSFVKSPNGNFMFNFSIYLIDEPEIKFPYDQRNIR